MISFVAANDEDVRFVNYYDFPFTNFSLVHFEARPFQTFKIVESMLVEFGEIKQFLLETVTL